MVTNSTLVLAAARHERAEETWLLADSSKYGRAGFVNVSPLSELTGVITDAGIGDESLQVLRETGIQVVVAQVTGRTECRSPW